MDPDGTRTFRATFKLTAKIKADAKTRGDDVFLVASVFRVSREDEDEHDDEEELIVILKRKKGDYHRCVLFWQRHIINYQNATTFGVYILHSSVSNSPTRVHSEFWR